MSKFGFVYIWRDRKHKRYYVGCHWGTYDDGYICSSNWMKQAYFHRPTDFKRRILKTSLTRKEMYDEEYRYFQMIKPTEIKTRYYNLHLELKKPWHHDNDKTLSIGQKISASKTGKPIIFKDPNERGRKISEAKKKAFQKRLEETGSKMPPDHKVGRTKGHKHTQEWKDAACLRIKQQWDEGIRSKEDAAFRMAGNNHAKR